MPSHRPTIISKFIARWLLVLLTSVLALSLTGCPSAEDKKKAEAAKIREATSIPDQSGDVTFQAFMSRLRQAVRAKDMNTIASMMTPDFGYRLEPPGEGDGVFAYWDKNNVWPELNLVLKDKFIPNGPYMVAPSEFVIGQNYRGYRAGMCLVEGGWRFAYFVNN
ncbi:hypothetical protein AYO41_03265 [Verrucomicrobia bacterium SCGC AG-212-E04]|nr:hypothetical protein AYO41_03265 [Verrucomicrobia bacterium SCGC AG-212-E04]